MFAPTPKGRLLGELANRLYDLLRGTSGAAQEEMSQDIENAIQKKEDELSRTRFAPLTFSYLLPILMLSACYVGP